MRRRAEDRLCPAGSVGARDLGPAEGIWRGAAADVEGLLHVPQRPDRLARGGRLLVLVQILLRKWRRKAEDNGPGAALLRGILDRHLGSAFRAD